LALVLGVFEFGRMIWLTQTANFAVNAASRYAATHGKSSTSKVDSAKISNIVKSYPGLSEATVISSFPGSKCPNGLPDVTKALVSGTEVIIEVSVRYVPLVGLVPGNAERTFKAKSVVCVMGPN
jgi:Flp pilus assembly protein TadG